MRLACAAIICAGFVAMLGNPGVSQEPKPKQTDTAKFSVIGSWKGSFNVRGIVTFEVRTTFRKDKTYTTTTISNVPTVATESGTYTYEYQSENFGVLTAKPSANGFSLETTAKITWNGPDQFIYEGNAVRITLSRVGTGTQFGSVGLAQDPTQAMLAQSGKGEQEETKDTRADRTSKAPAGRSLTPETLPEFLDNMGYDYKVVTMPSGATLCGITIQQESWRFYVEASLSGKQQHLWLLASLGALPEPSRLAAEPLLRLLEENWNTYPNYFAVHKEYRRIYLERALENRDITPARFRTAIDDFVGTIRRTHALWDTAKWGEVARRNGFPDGGKKPANGGPPATYPDTLQGLTRLFKELLAIAKAGGRDQLTARVKEFAIPDHDAWFRKIFGAEKGALAATEYGQGLSENQAALVRSLLTAAEEGQTEVQVERFTKPDPEYATGNQNRALELMQVKVPLNSVVLVKPGEETGLHLYSFVYVNGAFRCAGKMRALAARGIVWQPPNGNVIPATAIRPAVERLATPPQEDEIVKQWTAAVRPIQPNAAERSSTAITSPFAPTSRPLSGAQAEAEWNVLSPPIVNPQLYVPLRWQTPTGRNELNASDWQQFQPLRSQPMSLGLSALREFGPGAEPNRIERAALQNFIPTEMMRALIAPSGLPPLKAGEFRNLDPQRESPRP